MKHILITGASSGIGYELAKLFAKDGSSLILISRDKKRLEEIAKEFKDNYATKSLVIVIDLTNPQSSNKIKQELDKKKIQIDYLVNNAGFGTKGLFRDLDINREINMIDLNIKSLVSLTSIFLPDIIKNKGKILNVSSIAGFQPIPTMATYAATKAFVTSFSEALSNELKDSGVTVTTLCPGFTKTNFQKVAGIKEDMEEIMSAEEVAKIGYEKFLEGKGLVITGTKNKIGSVLGKILPTNFSASIAKDIIRNK